MSRSGIGIALSAAAVVMIAFAVVSLRPASAFEKAVVALRDTLSYSVEVEVTKPNRQEQLRLLRSGDTFRMESLLDGKVIETTITSRHRPGITIDNKSQTYIRRPPDRGTPPPLVMLEEFANFKGRGNELETKSISGREAVGFLIHLNEIDPDVPTGTLQMWVDAEANRPLELIMDFGVTGSMRYFDFRWNAEFAPELFSAKPPDSYVDRTPASVDNDELVDHITLALRIYRELIGTYPKVKIPFADRMRDQMFEKIGDKKDDVRSEEYAKVLRAMAGFTHITGLFRHKEDTVFYGRSVTAADSNNVLFRWRTEDGSYQVIYGDLHAELVSETQLRAIEGE